MNKLLGFDLFGSKINLLRDCDDTYHTLPGFIGTLLMVIAFVTVFYSRISGFFKLQFLEHKSFNTLFQNGNIHMDHSNFRFAVSITNLDLKSQTLLEVNVQPITRYANGSSSNNQAIQLVPCMAQDWNNIHNKYRQFYQINSLNNYLCSPLNYSFDLSGQFQSPVFKYVKISVRPKENQLQNIKQFLEGRRYFQFNFIFINNAINYSNTFMPFYNYPDKIFFRFVPFDSQLSVDQFIKASQINTDISVFPFEEITTVNSFEVTSNQKVTIVPSNINQKQFFRFFLRVENQQFVVDRKVESIVDFLSFLGGIFCFLNIFGSMLLTPYAQFKLKLQIFNSQYFLKPERSQATLDQYFHHDKIQSNFLKYIVFKLISLIRYFVESCPSFLDTHKYWVSEQLINQKIDIVHILTKMNYLQRTIDYITSRQQREIIRAVRFKAVQNERQDQITSYQAAKLLHDLKRKRDFLNYEKLVSIVEETMGCQLLLQKRMLNEQRTATIILQQVSGILA